jgi:hypothetical protein
MASRKPTAKELATEANYVLIQLGYERHLLVPHSDGMKILEALQHAEKYSDEYKQGPKIESMGIKDLKIELMSRETYCTIKTNQLLGIIPDTEDTAA